MFILNVDIISIIWLPVLNKESIREKTNNVLLIQVIVSMINSMDDIDTACHAYVLLMKRSCNGINIEQAETLGNHIQIYIRY